MLSRFIWGLNFCFLLAVSALAAQETPASTSSDKPQQKQEPLKEEQSETLHSVKIRGTTVYYKATTGTLLLKDKQGKAKASIFYVAYTKEGVDDITKRPITYCFNGGPGCASIWLHLGVFGPRKVFLNDEGIAVPPYHLEDNDYSILDATDLVFIDPVSTGFSRTAPGEDAKQYHGVNEDIESVAEFVRLYTTRNKRWASPKFIAGESYGSTRAAGLAGYLLDEQQMYFNGVILVSSVLNYQTLYDPQRGNDLPYILSLPSFTASAWYHKKLPADLQSKNLQDVLKESQEFALNEYSLALLKGDLMTTPERDSLIQKMARYTGLSPSYIDRANTRIALSRFSKELLRDEKRTLGRFDSRHRGIDYDMCGSYCENDPSADALAGGFASAFNHYVRNELKWEKDENYQILADVRPWDFGKVASNQFLNVADTLRETITRNPYLHVFVASGYFDLATPYFATSHTFNHLGLDPSLRGNVTMGYYEGGHMMYSSRPALIKLNNDLSTFILGRSQKSDNSGNVAQLPVSK